MLATREPLFGLIPAPLALLAAALIAGGLFAAYAWRLYRLLRLGGAAHRFDRPWERAKGFALHVLGQGRLLTEPYSGIMHALIFWGFVVITVMTVNLLATGLVPGLELPFISRNPVLLVAVETFQAFVLGALGMAFFRRLVLRPRRLNYNADAYIILSLITTLMVTAFLATSTQIAYEAQPWDRWSYVSSLLAPVWSGVEGETLAALHRAFWWAHVVTVLGFLAYLPHSKHLHIVTAPFNVWFRSLAPRGALPYRDVEAALEAGQSLGAGEVTDLSWKDLLDTYTCTECGRCQDACPASRTGKPLSPKDLILDLKHYLVEYGPVLLAGGGPQTADGGRPTAGDGAYGAPPAGYGPLGIYHLLPALRRLARPFGETLGRGPTRSTIAPPTPNPALVGDVITDEVLWDCTTCRACVDACPVFIDHVPKIVEMRRHLVMDQTRFGPDAQRLFDNLEASGNPWRFPRSTRADWAAGLDLPVLSEVSVEDVDVVYWVGCAGAHDARYQQVARAFARLLQHAGVRFAILGAQETCTGDPARRAGHEYLYQLLARQNVETLNALNVKKLVATCPHCFNTLKDEYPQLGGQYEVVHHSQMLAQLVREGRLTPTASPMPPMPNGAAGRETKTVTYHDPCYIGRYQRLFDPPREVLKALPDLELKEIPHHNRERAMCCGAGGARAFLEETRGTRINHLRLEHAEAAQPDAIATSCPYCIMMLEDATRTKGKYDALPVRDIAELLAASLGGTRLPHRDER
jgi:Fe-S oxidoreductase/nitrate reductase gamma subunit